MAQQKVVVKIMTMTDKKTKQKAIEAVADIYGVDSIAADAKEQKITVIGEVDTIAIAKKLKKIGKIDIVSVGPAKEEKKRRRKKRKRKRRKKRRMKRMSKETPAAFTVISASRFADTGSLATHLL